jgi:hypothetical protein
MPEPNRPMIAPPPATPAHQHSRGDEGGRIVDGHRPAGRGTVEDEPRDEDALASVPVAERAGGEQQPGERHGVGVHDPGQLGLAGAGGPGQVGQRDVQPADRGHHHHQRHRDDDEDGPAASGGEARGASEVRTR